MSTRGGAGAALVVALTIPGAAAALVGGQPTAEHPEVVALVLDGDRLCSGVLIAPRQVVTAAHCVGMLTSDGAGLQATFAQAADDPAPLGSVAASEIVVHPGYWTADRVDLAVVELAADAPVPPAAWSTEAPGEDWDLQPLTLVGTGWGSPQGSDEPWRRRAAEVRIDDLTVTHLMWWDDEAALCHGDSGGAVFAAGTSTLLAIATEGDPGCVTWGAGLRTDVFARFLADPFGPLEWDGLPGSGEDDIGPDEDPSGTGSGIDWDLPESGSAAPTGGWEAGCGDTSEAAHAWAGLGLPLLLAPAARRRRSS